MTAAPGGEVVVVRLTFVPAHLHTGLDELRDLLVGSEPLRRNVTLFREPDGTETLGVHEVLEIAFEVAGSNAGSNVLGGILGGVVESAVALWLIARAERSTRQTVAPPPPASDDGSRRPAQLIEGAGARYVLDADGRPGIDVRLTDRPEVNRAILAAGAILLAALAPADLDAPLAADPTGPTGPTGSTEPVT